MAKIRPNVVKRKLKRGEPVNVIASGECVQNIEKITKMRQATLGSKKIFRMYVEWQKS